MLACCIPVVSGHTSTEEAGQVQVQELGQHQHSHPGCIDTLVALAHTVADGWTVMIKPVNTPAHGQATLLEPSHHAEPHSNLVLKEVQAVQWCRSSQACRHTLDRQTNGLTDKPSSTETLTDVQGVQQVTSTLHRGCVCLCVWAVYLSHVTQCLERSGR